MTIHDDTILWIRLLRAWRITKERYPGVAWVWYFFLVLEDEYWMKREGGEGSFFWTILKHVFDFCLFYLFIYLLHCIAFDDFGFPLEIVQ
jgi:hypothetical protein